MREKDKNVDKKAPIKPIKPIKDPKKVKKVKSSQPELEDKTEDSKVDDRAKVEEMFEQAEMEHHDLNCLKMLFLITNGITSKNKNKNKMVGFLFISQKIFEI